MERFATAQKHMLHRADAHLRFCHTAVALRRNITEYTVGLLDGEQFVYYDREIKKMIPRAKWMKKAVAENPDCCNRETQTILDHQETFRSNVEMLMKHFTKTEGVHTVQCTYGCQLDDDGTKRQYWQFGYDGEDFLSLDLNTETLTAAVPQAIPIKQKWESEGEPGLRKAYLMNVCPEWLQKYADYGRYTLESKVSPEVSLFQKDSSSPVVCHATGFFPKALNISWQKNGEDVHEDVDLRETLPNNDGTFQKRIILTVSPDELNRNQYTCFVQHSSLEQGKVFQVSDRRVLQDGGSIAVIAAAVFSAVLIVLIVLFVCVWKKKNRGLKPVPSSPRLASDLVEV